VVSLQHLYAVEDSTAGLQLRLLELVLKDGDLLQDALHLGVVVGTELLRGEGLFGLLQVLQLRAGQAEGQGGAVHPAGGGGRGSGRVPGPVDACSGEWGNGKICDV